MQSGVVIFDLCSSTEIIEGLQARNKIMLYNELFCHIETLIKILSQRFGCQIYKFLGDGFILTTNKETTTEEIILMCSIICKTCNTLLNEGILEEISFTPKRIGFTFGYDIGEIYSLNIKDKNEFTGKVINLSSRLQSGLSEKNDANKLMISFEAKKSISEPEIKKLATYGKKERSFKNIDADRPIKCYSFDLYSDNIYKLKDKLGKRKYPVRYVKTELPTEFFEGSKNVINSVLIANKYEDIG